MGGDDANGEGFCGEFGFEGREDDGNVLEAVAPVLLGVVLTLWDWDPGLCCGFTVEEWGSGNVLGLEEVEEVVVLVVVVVVVLVVGVTLSDAVDAGFFSGGGASGMSVSSSESWTYSADLYFPSLSVDFFSVFLVTRPVNVVFFALAAAPLLVLSFSPTRFLCVVPPDLDAEIVPAAVGVKRPFVRSVSFPVA